MHRPMRTVSSDMPDSRGGRNRQAHVLPYPQPIPPPPINTSPNFPNLPDFIRRQLTPMRCSTPPRPRPAIFYYVFTLLYAQNGLTRKFRHYLPCSHNVTYLGIQDTQKRHIFASGCHCMICPFCEEIQISHLHLNIFQCPCTDRCPTVNRVPATLVEAKIEHNCFSHQEGMPHPNDLNSLASLPMPVNTPFQFSYHTTLTQDSVLLADALYGRNPGFNGVNLTHEPARSPPPPYAGTHRMMEESVLRNRFFHPNFRASAEVRPNGSYATQVDRPSPTSTPTPRTPPEVHISDDEHDVSISVPTEPAPLDLTTTPRVDQDDFVEKLCAEVIATDGELGGQTRASSSRTDAPSPPINP